MKVKRRTTTALKNRSDNSEKNVGGNILKQREFVVQLLESEPSGNAKKYERIGAQEFVKFEYEEVNLSDIKEACTEHFSDSMPPGMSCDILASQRGSVHLVQRPSFRIRL